MSFLRFPCGGRLPPTGDMGPVPGDWNRRKKDGHVCLCVYDSDGSAQQPVLVRAEDARGRWGKGEVRDGMRVPCMWACPAKRAGGRKETRCFHEDDWLAAHPGCERTWRTVVTCHAEEVEHDRKPMDCEVAESVRSAGDGSPEPFCACGRRMSECDKSRAKCCTKRYASCDD